MAQEKKNAFLTQNTVFGLFVGLSFILTSYIYYRSGRAISMNPQLNNVIMLLSIAGAFIGVRKYRDESLFGTITFGTALGACTYLITVAAMIYSMYIYYLYHQHPELQENYIGLLESILEEVYKGSPLLDNMKTMLEAFLTPVTIAFAEFFNKIFTGFIFSLFLAGILRKNQKI